MGAKIETSGLSCHSVRAGRRGDFLGQASLGWADLELLPGEDSRELNLTLGYRDGAPKRDQELVQGTIKMLVEAPVIKVRGGRRATDNLVIAKYYPTAPHHIITTQI